MKTLSVLITFALLLTAGLLPARLKKLGLLPVAHETSPANPASRQVTPQTVTLKQFASPTKRNS